MYKVMVIDDEDNLRQALEQLLVSNGYAFCGARDAESGLELLASEHPDLLLLDVMLPGTNGFDLCSRIREQGRRIRRHKDTIDFARCRNREGVARIGELEVRFGEYEVRVKGRPVALTTKEFEIVAFLAAHPGKVFTRSQIQEYIWGESDADCKPTNNITVFVRKIREKIEENPSEPKYLLTVQRVGYKMADTLE